MGNSVTYPDGTTLVSSALTVQQIGVVLQPISLGMLGLPIAADSSNVRLEWPTQGQPFVTSPTVDVCFLRCVTKDDPYDKIRDRFSWGPNGWGDGQFGREPFGGTLSGNPALTEQWTYTRVWQIHWCFYGPNSTDNARALRSGLFQDYFTNLLATSQLFPMCDFPQPVRAPELIDAQWWDRSDFECEMYEFITETIQRQTVVSVEVIVQNPAGVVADITIT